MNQPTDTDYSVRVPYDFGVGYINPDTLPLQAIGGLASTIVSELGDELARYPARLGWEPLRHAVGQLRAERGEPRPDVSSTVITGGSLGAIALAAKAALNHNDTVLVEEWTYNLALEIFRQRGLQIVPLPMDDSGLTPDALGPACDRAQRSGGQIALYTVPTFQNPTGIVVPLERRREIVSFARERDLTILEDDSYGDLRMEGVDIPSLWSLAPERTILIGSFSKVLSPAMRLGYAVAPVGLVDPLLANKLDGGTDLLASALAAAFLEQRGSEHLAAVRGGLRNKRDFFVDALLSQAPELRLERVPEGGLFLWARLPDGISSDHLLAKARARGITFFPTSSCRADGQDGLYVRLCFSWPSYRVIRSGIDELVLSLAEVRDAAAVGVGRA